MELGLDWKDTAKKTKWTDTYSAIQTVRYALKSTQKSSVDYFKRDYIMYGPAFYFEYFRKLHSFASRTQTAQA